MYLIIHRRLKVVLPQPLSGNVYLNIEFLVLFLVLFLVCK